MSAPHDPARTPPALSEAALRFLTDRHLATLTTRRADSSAHVVPVGFTYEAETGTARVITDRASAKVGHVRAFPGVALCQVDGRDWLTLEGDAVVRSDAAAVAEAVRRYSARYRVPRESPTRVAIEITVTRVMSSRSLRG